MFCFCPDSTNSSENIYTMMNPIGPGGNRPNVSVFVTLGHADRFREMFPKCESGIFPLKVLIIYSSSSRWDLGLMAQWEQWEPWSHTT